MDALASWRDSLDHLRKAGIIITCFLCHTFRNEKYHLQISHTTLYSKRVKSKNPTGIQIKLYTQTHNCIIASCHLNGFLNLLPSNYHRLLIHRPVKLLVRKRERERYLLIPLWWLFLFSFRYSLFTLLAVKRNTPTLNAVLVQLGNC